MWVTWPRPSPAERPAHPGGKRRFPRGSAAAALREPLALRCGSPGLGKCSLPASLWPPLPGDEFLGIRHEFSGVLTKSSLGEG